MSFYVYILKCSDGSYYTGHTDTIENRLSEHQAGTTSYTQTRLPVMLMFMQDFATRSEALEAEMRIKKWSRKKKEALIAHNWDLLQELARRRSGNVLIKK
ncbi:MAG: GIY-YIG nuclease family protein [Candidatus Dependentiae bacterium]|nr:GIY-YIG nuclease family protein [Candidatus Dependentiae bacterium]